MPSRKPLTAAELMCQLESDPEWVARRERRDARHRVRADEHRQDEASLIDDLARIGIDCSSAYDFVNRGVTPAAAFPILVAHLDQSHIRNVREGIIRALAQRDARSLAFEPLVRHYRSEPDTNLRWVIANALSVMAAFHEVESLPSIDQYRKLFRRA